MRYRPLAKRLFVVAGLLAATAAVGWGCSKPSPRQVTCDQTSIGERDYCVYSSQAITETGYDCPEHLPEGVSMGEGTVCTKDGEIPKKHRDDLRRRVDGTTPPKDTGIVMTDTGSPDGGSADAVTCEAPSTCPAGSSSATDPTYHCHKPSRPTVGQPVDLTIYGQHLTTFSDGNVEIATDTGYKQEIQVDHRCKVTVELPDYVWGGGDSFTVTVKNSAGEFQFDIRGN